MQLKRLIISREEYGAAKGKLKGAIEFNGPYGKVELPLDEMLSKEILNLCSDGVVRASRQIADELTADIVEGATQLPAPE